MLNVFKNSAIYCAKLVAADALDKNPENVIATCIEDKNLVGSFNNFCNITAFLLPFSADIFIFVFFDETIASSAAANNAFIVVNIIITIICVIAFVCSFILLNFSLLFSKYLII